MNGTKMLLLGFVCLCLIGYVQAQTAKPLPQSALMAPYHLEVACNKTTHLVFPFSIVTVDRGSESILAQKATGVENILRVKAGVKNFEQTSLGVITSDGKLYSFLVDFCPMPTSLNISLGNAGEQVPLGNVQTEHLSTMPMVQNEAFLKMLVQKAQVVKRNIRGLRSEKSGISMRVDGMYVNEGVMLLRLFLRNASVINYDIDQLRLYIRDKKVGKRTAVQERELHALYQNDNMTLVSQKSGHYIILALPKFTIPDGKFLAIEMTEQNGGRNLYLNVKNKHVMKAKPIE